MYVIQQSGQYTQSCLLGRKDGEYVGAVAGSAIVVRFETHAEAQRLADELAAEHASLTFTVVKED